MDETQNTIQCLGAYILQSSLSQEDKALWADGIQKINERTAQDILSYLEELPEDIQYATEMLKRKIGALKNNDTAAWNQILTEEKEKIKNLSLNE